MVLNKSPISSKSKLSMYTCHTAQCHLSPLLAEGRRGNGKSRLTSASRALSSYCAKVSANSCEDVVSLRSLKYTPWARPHCTHKSM
eukprot:3028207-Karenia_brevis.AAC.1